MVLTVKLFKRCRAVKQQGGIQRQGKGGGLLTVVEGSKDDFFLLLGRRVARDPKILSCSMVSCKRTEKL